MGVLEILAVGPSTSKKDGGVDGLPNQLELEKLGIGKKLSPRGRNSREVPGTRRVFFAEGRH